MLGASVLESLCLVLCYKQVLAGEEEVWRRGTAPLGRGLGSLDAKPLEAGYKILLSPPEWEEECVSPEKQGQRTICVLGDL